MTLTVTNLHNVFIYYYQSSSTFEFRKKKNNIFLEIEPVCIVVHEYKKIAPRP